jgi:hypothetical protein
MPIIGRPVVDMPISCRVRGVGAHQDRSAGGDDLLGAAVVDIGQGQQRDPAVAMLEGGTWRPLSWDGARSAGAGPAWRRPPDGAPGADTAVKLR